MADLIAALVFIFVTNYATTDAIALECSYEMYEFAVIGSKYRCTARPLIDQDDTVNAVYGTHQTGKGHLDVEGIYIAAQNLPFFPRNMEEFFPNLLAIYLGNNSITAITNSHFIPFPNLRFLSLFSNKITTLDSNVFSGMWTSSDSYYISFHSNNIKHIAHDINLPNNGWIHFNTNMCINEQATTPDQISILKLNLLRNCPPTISQIEGTLESRPNLLTRLENRNIELEIRITELETRNTELEKSRTELETRSTQLETRVAFIEALIENKLGLNIEKGINES